MPGTCNHPVSLRKNWLLVKIFFFSWLLLFVSQSSPFVAQYQFLCVVFCRSLFVPFLLSFNLQLLLIPFRIFKLFLQIVEHLHVIQYGLVRISIIKDTFNLLELAFAISFVSLGSNHTLFLPHLSTAAANRFCNRRVLKNRKYQKFTM